MGLECYVCGDDENVAWKCPRCGLFFCDDDVLTTGDYDFPQGSNGPACPNCSPICVPVTNADRIAAEKDDEEETGESNEEKTEEGR